MTVLLRWGRRGLFALLGVLAAVVLFGSALLGARSAPAPGVASRIDSGAAGPVLATSGPPSREIPSASDPNRPPGAPPSAGQPSGPDLPASQSPRPVALAGAVERINGDRLIIRNDRGQSRTVLVTPQTILRIGPRRLPPAQFRAALGGVEKLVGLRVVVAALDQPAPRGLEATVLTVPLGQPGLPEPAP